MLTMAGSLAKTGRCSESQTPFGHETLELSGGTISRAGDRRLRLPSGPAGCTLGVARDVRRGHLLSGVLGIRHVDPRTGIRRQVQSLVRTNGPLRLF